MATRILIVGQGISGTWLSYWLMKSGADVVVIDEARPHTASRIASGIINPVTGRRMVKTWMANELMDFAHAAYEEIGDALEASFFTPMQVYDFFSAPDRRLSFEKRAQQFDEFLLWPQDENDQLPYFNYPFGYGIVSPAYWVDVQNLLALWRRQLELKNALLNGRFDVSKLTEQEDGVIYNGQSFDKIIFCDGMQAMQLPYFSMLPFALNKGEALIVSIPGLPEGKIYKKTNTIAPWHHGMFWVGSTYDREYKDDQPTKQFCDQTKAWLQSFLRLPFTIEEHVAAIRPTTVERRPFAGLHPQYPNVGILNGMGTKGVSLAPFLAKQLCDHLLYQQPLMPEVDIAHYRRVLQRI